MPHLLLGTTNLAMHPNMGVFGSPGVHQGFLEAAGYRQGAELEADAYHGAGFEWFDLRNVHNPLGGVALRLAAEGDIISLHQSWRSTNFGDIASRLFHPSDSWNGVRNTPWAVLQAVGRWAVVPHIDASLSRLEKIQEAAGIQLPLVAYPNQQQPPTQPKFFIDYSERASKFTQLRHQPTVETLQAWGVSTQSVRIMIDDMLEKQAAYGFRGVAWDTKHGYEERHGMRFEDPIGMVEELASRGCLEEVHLNITGDPGTLARALDQRLHEAHHGRILQAAFDAMPSSQTLLVITEVTARDFTDIGKADLVGGHRQLIRAILDLAT